MITMSTMKKNMRVKRVSESSTRTTHGQCTTVICHHRLASNLFKSQLMNCDGSVYRNCLRDPVLLAIVMHTYACK